MTKYKRFTGKVFGGNATAIGDDPQIAQFGSALAGTFVGTTDPEVIQQLPAWGQGFIDAVTPETQYPALPEFTGLLKVLSHQICTILQEGVSSWDSGTIYYKGNFVSKNGMLFLSLTDENQGNDPETDITNWVNLMALAAHAPMPSNRYTNLTLGASGTRYTAPADGWFVLDKTANNNNQYITLIATALTIHQWVPIRNASCAGFIPVAKGESVRVTYTAGGNTNQFAFVYAEGAI